MFGSTLKERKNREIYQNGTAFRSFANFDEANPNHREAMEDCNSAYSQNPLSMTASSKTAPSQLSSESWRDTAGQTSAGF